MNRTTYAGIGMAVTLGLAAGVAAAPPARDAARKDGAARWMHTAPFVGTAYSGLRTSDGGFVAVGNARSDSGKGAAGFYVLGLDARGRKLWERAWGRTDVDGIHHRAYDAVETSGGGVVVTGTVHRPDHHESLVVMQLDRRAAPRWERAVLPRDGGRTGAAGHSIRHAADGGFLVGGILNAPFSAPRISGSAFFALLLRLDADGAERWSHLVADYAGNTHRGAPRQPHAFNDMRDAAIVEYDWLHDRVLVEPAPGGDFFAAWNSRPDPRKFSTQFHISRWDAQARHAWTRTVGDVLGSHAAVAGLVAGDAGSVVVTGSATTRKLREPGEYDLGFIMALDATGAPLWHRYFADGETNRAIPRGIAATADGGTAVCGDATPYGRSFLAKFGRDGDVEWSQVLDVEGSRCYHVRQLPDGGFLLSGTHTRRALFAVTRTDAQGRGPLATRSGRIRRYE